MSSPIHKRKLNFFCRICAEVLINPDQKGYRYNKSTVEDIVREIFGDDFKSDSDSEHPEMVCKVCYKGLTSWKEQKKKYDKHKKRNLEQNIPFNPKTNLPDNLKKGTMLCSSDGNCCVCKLEIFDHNKNIGPSPSKFQKMTDKPIVSPSDLGKKSPASKSSMLGKAKRSILVEKSEAEHQAEGEKESVKIYVSEDVFDINQCVDPEIALLYLCSICSHVPKHPYKIVGCQHIVCPKCVSNYKSKTRSSKCPFQDCQQVYNSTQVVPLTGRDASMYNSLKMNCTNHSCNFQSGILQIDEHASTCTKRGAYKNVRLRGKRSNFTDEKLKHLVEALDKFCVEGKLDQADALFFLLVDKLRKSEISLYRNANKLYEFFSAGVDNVDDYIPDKPNPLKSAALKSFANLTVGQYQKLALFEKGEALNSGEAKHASYKALLKAEKECDVGNIDYKLVDKVNENVNKIHKATLDDPSIDISHDVGSLPPGLLNIPVDGSRVSLIDSIALALSQKIPDIVKIASNQFPGLWLPDFTLRAHVKVAWDGTLGKSQSPKEWEREESDHWLAGCIGLLQIDIEWGDGTRSIIWSEKNPNSILSCIPLGLYKGEEGNSPTLSYIMNAVDSEALILSKSFIEMESEVTIPTHVVENHTLEDTEAADPIQGDCRMETQSGLGVDETPKQFDDVVKDELLGKYMDVKPSVTKSEQAQKMRFKLRFNIRLTNPKDEKFDRNVRGKAGAGSSRPCVHCNLTLSECMKEENFGTLPIEYNPVLEMEAADYFLDNPLELSRKNLDEVSLGMKRLRLTNSEVKTDVSDSLHMHINVSGSFMFKIGCRIFCFGSDMTPVYHWDKTAAVKERIEQAEALYAKQLKSVITTLPSLNQMPGNFGRAYISSENRAAVIDPLPECEEKAVFSNILEQWEKMAIIHCKTSPTAQDRSEYDKLVRYVQSLVSSLKWIKRWPNQFIRACHHNGVFLNDPEGTGSMGPHSTEPLESGNHWIKLYDDGYTFRGDRNSALKGVFKLRRMKSSPKLQKFYPKQDKQIQKCSVCKNPGHNSRNATCPGPPMAQEVPEEELSEGAEDQLLEVNPHADVDNIVEVDDSEETEDNPDASLNLSYFVTHFVDETVIDDD